MATASNTASKTGVSFLPLLTLLFIGLKLGGLIDWSWWLVLLPLYGPVAVVCGTLLIVAAGAYLIVSIAELGEWLSQQGRR